MKLIRFNTDGVKFLNDIDHWFGIVDVTFQEPGSVVAQDLQLKIRTPGNVDQSYREAEAAIQAQAVLVLSRATDTLSQNTHEELQTMLGK